MYKILKLKFCIKSKGIEKKLKINANKNVKRKKYETFNTIADNRKSIIGL